MVILVPTCERYAVLLHGLHACMEKYWPDRPWELIIATGSPRPDIIQLPYTQFHYGYDAGWCSNLMTVLQWVTDDLIMLILEDQYPCEPIDTMGLSELAAFMASDLSIGSINLRPWGSDKLGGRTIGEWAETPELPLVGDYNLLTSETLIGYEPRLWRRQYLFSILAPWENPWEAEKNGTIRARAAGKRILGTIPNFYPHENIAVAGERGKVHWRPGAKVWLQNTLGAQHPAIMAAKTLLTDRRKRHKRD